LEKLLQQDFIKISDQKSLCINLFMFYCCRHYYKLVEELVKLVNAGNL
jgi:hypothetical protein